MMEPVLSQSKAQAAYTARTAIASGLGLPVQTRSPTYAPLVCQALTGEGRRGVQGEDWFKERARLGHVEDGLREIYQRQ